MTQEIIERLSVAIIRGRIGADNDNYLMPLTIADGEAMLAELRRLHAVELVYNLENEYRAAQSRFLYSDDENDRTACTDSLRKLIAARAALTPRAREKR